MWELLYNFSRFRNNQRVRLQLSAIENARALDAAFLQVSDILFTFREGDLQANASTLLHFCFLHLRHSLSRKVEPLSRAQHSILRFIVCHRCLESLLD